MPIARRRLEVLDQAGERRLERIVILPLQEFDPRRGHAAAAEERLGDPSAGADQRIHADDARTPVLDRLEVPHLGEIDVAESRAVASCFAEVGPAEVGPAEVGPAEDGTAEVGIAEVGTEEVGIAEVGMAEVGMAALYPSDNDTAQYRTVICARTLANMCTHPSAAG